MLHRLEPHPRPETIGEGIARQMVVGDRLMICRLRFQPRVVTTPHDHPHEQMTVVEKGRVLFTIGDEQREVGPGDDPALSRRLCGMVRPCSTRR